MTETSPPVSPTLTPTPTTTTLRDDDDDEQDGIMTKGQWNQLIDLEENDAEPAEDAEPADDEEPAEDVNEVAPVQEQEPLNPADDDFDEENHELSLKTVGIFWKGLPSKVRREQFYLAIDNANQARHDLQN